MYPKSRSIRVRVPPRWLALYTQHFVYPANAIDRIYNPIAKLWRDNVTVECIVFRSDQPIPRLDLTDDSVVIGVIETGLTRRRQNFGL